MFIHVYEIFFLKKEMRWIVKPNKIHPVVCIILLDYFGYIYILAFAQQSASIAAHE